MQIQTHKPGRNDPCPCGSGKRYKQCCGRLGDTAPASQLSSVEAMLEAALSHHQAGRMPQAEELYRNVLQAEPDQADALHLLGLLTHQSGNGAGALELMRRAIAIAPTAAMHCNLGNVLQEQGSFDEAISSYEAGLVLAPDNTNMLNSMGVALRGQGRLEEAVARFRQALLLQPGYVEAHSNRGNALREQGLWAAAAESFLTALSLRPDHARALSGLAAVRFAQGEVGQAFDLAMRALLQEEAQDTKALLAQCVLRMDFGGEAAAGRALLLRALTEAWGRPDDLMPAAIRLVKSDLITGPRIERAAKAWPALLEAADLFGPGGIDAIAGNALLLSMLESAPVCDQALELFLTMVRRSLLEIAIKATDVPRDESVLGFGCALASQCFINEYIYACSEEEIRRAQALWQRLAAAPASVGPVAALQLAVVAAYFPLASLPLAEALLDRDWPAAVSTLLVQQLREPMEEREYHASIPALTPVEDGVSRLVRAQYEQNPYPRWVTSAQMGEAVPLDAFLRRRFPFGRFKPLGRRGQLDVLIAGCGTGQHSTETAQLFSGARVLALDLSLASLAYAKRKTRELGLTNIEYAQADITRLSSLGRSFDLIESVGVLHHLADPMLGWRALLSLLRPGGFMRLGFYSETGRRGIVAARRLIAERGYAATLDDMRRCRQELMSLGGLSVAGAVAQSIDFYAASGCRDMLFHVQEHRYTLAQLGACLKELGLDFVGFLHQPPVLAEYSARFPGDRSMSSLEFWSLFEMDNPATFTGMYQFWVQKRDLF